MPSNFSDMLNTLINYKQVQNQTQQIAQAGAAQAVQGVSTFMDLARHTADPATLTALVDRFAQLGVGNRQQLMGILQHVTPTSDATKDYLTKLGVDIKGGKRPEGTTDELASTAGEAANVNTTGMNAGQLGASGFLASVFQHANPNDPELAAGLASRTATGMTPGDMAVDAAQAALPASELTQQGGIKGGSRMTAAQDASNQLGWANLRANARSDEVRNAQNMVALGISKEQADAAMKKAEKNGVSPEAVVNLVEAKTKLMNLIRDKKTMNPSKQEVLGWIGNLNAINAAMSAYGLPNEGQVAFDPNMLTQPGFFDSFLSRNTSVPQNVAPPGTGRR